jgi:O-antigen/teichoic acid export membrane protein
MSLSSKIVSNTLISYAGRAVSIAFALIIVGLITRSLGQEGFGEYVTVLAFLSLFVILADLGLHSLMTREISREEDSGPVASNFFTLRLIASLFFLLFGFGAAFLFPYTIEVKLGIGIGALGFFFLSVHQLLLGVFQKHLAMHLAALAEIAGRGAQLLFVFLIYLYVRGETPHIVLFMYLVAMSASSFVIFFLTFLFAQRYTRIGLRFDIPYWLKIIKTTWPIALSIVLTLIYFKIDMIFLSLMKPAADVGIYGAAYRVLEGLIFFPAMFAGILMPILSRDAVNNHAHFKEVFRKSMRVIAIFALPLVGGGVVLSYSITNLIGGKDFIIAGAPMQALFMATGIIFFGNILGRAIIALDLQKKAMFAYLLGVVLNVVLNLIFIPKYTYMGAAWSTVITELLVVAFLFWLVWRKTGAFLDISGVIKAAFAAAVMVGVLLFFASPISAPLSFSGLGLAMLAGAGIYFGVLYVVGGIKRQEVRSLFMGARR